MFHYYMAAVLKEVILMIRLVLEISKVCSLSYVHIIEAIVTERIVTVGGRYEKKIHLADGHWTPASTVI